MTTKPWPKLPDPPLEPPEGFYVDWPSPITVPDTTVCKHGKGSCETCGTTNRRETIHKTERGTGVVGRLRKRRS